MSFICRPRRTRPRFVAYHEGGDWREKDSAERLLEALEANIHTWFEQNYATKTEWKAELVKMYGNGMTCTLHDFRQPHLADQMAGDMERLMKVIRLHSGQGTTQQVCWMKTKPD